MLKKRYYLNPALEINFSTPIEQSFFFGYYDKSPISKDGSKLLAHKVNFEGRNPVKEDKVEIGYFNLNNKQWVKLAESNAFNWQQGTMLQWLGPDFNSRVIFNDSDQDRFVSRIVNINDNNYRIVPKAVYSVDPKGEFSISLNFERSYWVRAYSYASIKDSSWNHPIPDKDGILTVNLKTGESKTIISLRDLVSRSTGLKTPGDHWVEHIMLNPEGSRFGFIHRYGTNEKFHTNLFTADINGNNLWTHPYNSEKEFTHMGWKDSEMFAMYTIASSKSQEVYKNLQKRNSHLKKLISVYRKHLKPYIPKKITTGVLKQNNYYSLIKDQSGIIINFDSKNLGLDGHPSFTKDGRFMLTDTYEDNNSFRHLFLFDTLSNNKILLGKFYSHYNSCGWRADLHPRFSFDDNYITIDSTHNGYHQILVLKINWEIIK